MFVSNQTNHAALVPTLNGQRCQSGFVSSKSDRTARRPLKNARSLPHFVQRHGFVFCRRQRSCVNSLTLVSRVHSCEQLAPRNPCSRSTPELDSMKSVLRIGDTLPLVAAPAAWTATSAWTRFESREGGEERASINKNWNDKTHSFGFCKIWLCNTFSFGLLTSTVTEPDVVVLPGFPVSGIICRLLGTRFSSLNRITARPKKSTAAWNESTCIYSWHGRE